MKKSQKNIRNSENRIKMVIVITIILFVICCMPFYSFAESESSNEYSIQECEVSNGGYNAIFTSGTTGRQFKEFKQNVDYNYPSIVNSYWGQECGTLTTGIIGSGYKDITMQDIADELNANNGETDFSKFLKDFTGQDIICSSVSSIDEFVNALSNGSVAVIHDYGVLDINKDKSKVYVSNSDANRTGADGMSQGWNSIDFVYNAIQKSEIYFIVNEGSYIDYNEQIVEDKIFYIGDSWMVGLNESGKAKSPSSYFYAEGEKNADWVLNTYSNMTIPSDTSCIVVEFGLNELSFVNWNETQELVDKLAEDYSEKKIFVLQTPHICDGYTVDANFNSKVDDYNRHMREYCDNKEGVIYINPTTNIVSSVGTGYLKDEYASDPSDTSQGGGKIHLNSDGYEVWYNDIISLITTNNEIGDGWDSITTVNYPNGVKRTFRNYKQYKGSYSNKPYWEGTISFTGCAPTAVSIILSGYGIDANPGEVANSIAELGYNYSSFEALKKVLKDKYNIDSEIEFVSSDSIQHIKDNFNEGRPIIAGVENHFVTYLGEDSEGNMILSDPGYTDGRNENTVNGYVNSHNGYQILLIKTGKDPLETIVKDYKIEEENNTKYIENIPLDTTIEELKENIETNGVIEVDKRKNKVTNENLILGTGMIIKVKLDGQEETYEAVVTGDITGDGQISIADVLRLARYNAKLDKNVTGAYLRATEVVSDGNIGSISDILKLSRVLAKLDNI